MSCSGFRAEGRASEGMCVRPGNRTGRTGPDRARNKGSLLGRNAESCSLSDQRFTGIRQIHHQEPSERSASRAPPAGGALTPEPPRTTNRNICFSSSWDGSF